MSDLQTNKNYDQFGDSVLDSDRARQKPLVDPSHLNDFDELQENIKIRQQSEPKITSSQTTEHKNASLPLNGASYDLQKAAHPTVCVMTFAFKAASFVIYLLIGNFISSILTFIFVLVLSAIDFWVVKNISGRLLVGLRWRSEYDSNEKEVWKFESYDHQFHSNPVDRLFFWTSQVIFTVLWGILLLLNVLTLDLFWVKIDIMKALLLLITAGLCGVNLYGYYQCRGQHKKKIERLQKKYGKKVFQSIVQSVM